MALSVDEEAASATLVAKRHLSFPVDHSADADAIASAAGACTNADPHHLQSTGFVLSPQRTVMTAVYSSGAIGRLVPEDVVGLLRYIQSQQ